jgi:prophage antirepressor-like protein
LARRVISVHSTVHDVDFKIIDKDGNKWVTVKQTAQATHQTLRALRKLIADLRYRGEMREGVHFMFTPLPTPGGEQITMILSYLGLTRIFMRSDAPRAQEFRDWAETVLGPVMTQGYYLPAETRPALIAEVKSAVFADFRTEFLPIIREEMFHAAPQANAPLAAGNGVPRLAKA